MSQPKIRLSVCGFWRKRLTSVSLALTASLAMAGLAALTVQQATAQSSLGVSGESGHAAVAAIRDCAEGSLGVQDLARHLDGFFGQDKFKTTGHERNLVRDRVAEAFWTELIEPALKFDPDSPAGDEESRRAGIARNLGALALAEDLADRYGLYASEKAELAAKRVPLSQALATAENAVRERTRDWADRQDEEAGPRLFEGSIAAVAGAQSLAAPSRELSPQALGLRPFERPAVGSGTEIGGRARIPAPGELGSFQALISLNMRSWSHIQKAENAASSDPNSGFSTRSSSSDRLDHRPNKAEPRIETAAIPEGSAPQPLAQEPDLQWLFWLCAFVTAMLWLSTVHDFIAQAPELDHANPVTTIYLAILGVYAGSKHLLRRSGVSEADERLIRGEYFVILWVATLAVMAMLQFYPTAHQALPYDFWRILYGVLGIFCGTKAAKAFLPSKPQNPESWTPNGARKNPADRTA